MNPLPVPLSCSHTRRVSRSPTRARVLMNTTDGLADRNTLMDVCSYSARAPRAVTGRGSPRTSVPSQR